MCSPDIPSEGRYLSISSSRNTPHTIYLIENLGSTLECKRSAPVGWRIPILQIKCSGRGSYQRTRLTAGGFPRGYLMRRKSVFGFQTGDLVRAEVTVAKNQGAMWEG